MELEAGALQSPGSWGTSRETWIRKAGAMNIAKELSVRHRYGVAGVQSHLGIYHGFYSMKVSFQRGDEDTLQWDQYRRVESVDKRCSVDCCGGRKESQTGRVSESILMTSTPLTLISFRPSTSPVSRSHAAL